MRNGRAFLILLFFATLIVLFLFDPEEGGYPSCPFRRSTGLLCPGCGSLRALHDLSHLRFAEAFAHNALLLLAIPVAGLQLAHKHLSTKEVGATRRNWWPYLWLGLILGWGVFRNVYVSPSTGH